MRLVGLYRVAVSVILGFALSLPAAAQGAQGAYMSNGLSSRSNICATQAAAYHGVNADVLRAILLVESGGRPLVVNRNPNGTLDVGIAQINSIHFDELRRYGIQPAHLFDECIAIFVAAWHYAKQVRLYGHTWQAIGAYHSRTRVHNERYQRLVYRELLKMGVYRLPPAQQGAAAPVFP